jgi:hypothetical protein
MSYQAQNILDSPIISKNIQKATARLLQLSEHLLHKDQTLWVEYYYNSATMAKFLKSCHGDGFGTVQANRKAMKKKLQ